MNLYSIIATLLATSVSADYFYDGNPGYLQPAASYYSPAYAPSYLGSDDPQPGARCYHGNQRNVAPATQAPYPPCWYKQGDGEWACFNQVNGKCPWDGAKSPPGSGGNNNVCYHGNQRNVPPATRAPYPPCWYKQSDGAWACFNQVNGQCPWPGAVGPQASAYLNAPSSYTRRPLYYNRRPFCYNGAQRNSINYGPNWPECWYRPNGQDWDCYSKVNGQCPFAGAVGPQVSAYLNTPSFLGSDDPQPGDKCYHGNQRNVAPATQAPYPPCWYKQGDGAWACFNQVNGKCPWDGAKNPPSSGGNSKTCYAGNMRDKPITSNYPPCWYKQNDGAWACFDKVNGQCPWGGAVGPQAFAYLNTPSFFGSDDPQPGDKCYHGNQRNVAPATQAPYPPCWYKQSDGAWACFNQVNGKCPWDGAKNPPGSGGGKAICYHGNQRNVPPATQAPYPPCWYKQSDGAWACFNKVNGNCPWDGAVGPQASFY